MAYLPRSCRPSGAQEADDERRKCSCNCRRIFCFFFFVFTLDAIWIIFFHAFLIGEWERYLTPYCATRRRGSSSSAAMKSFLVLCSERRIKFSYSFFLLTIFFYLSLALSTTATTWCQWKWAPFILRRQLISFYLHLLISHRGRWREKRYSNNNLSCSNIIMILLMFLLITRVFASAT